jgi:Hypothetical glycosyl hydrolase family 15
MMSMARRSLLLGLLAAVACAQMHTASAQSFPRLGGYLIGSPQQYDQQESKIAKLGVAVLQMYPGWKGPEGQTPQEVIKAIKAENPDIRIFLYTNISVLQYPILDETVYAALHPIQTTPWWLRTSKTGGSMVLSSFGGDYYQINTSTYSKVDSQGQNYPSWRSTVDKGLFVTPNPSVDGIYIDNVYWKPRVNGDWTLSGTIQSDANATTQEIYRLGFVAYINHLKSLMGSGKYVTGNVADWGGTGAGPADIAQYKGVLAGGVMESIIGQSYSYEAWKGWAGMMAYYTTVMQATASPQLMIFSQDGSTTDYQGMRYGLCSALLGNAYYFYDQGGGGKQNYSTYIAFDEFNSKLGAALVGPLVFPGAKAWQKGVYRRDFEDGIALVNPKGNGTQTVTLETTYKHIKGTQDPAVNNGETVTEVTLPERDGLILLRLTPKSTAVPSAPALTVH